MLYTAEFCRTVLLNGTELSSVGATIQVHGIFREGSVAQAALSEKGLVHSNFGRPAEKRTSGGNPVSVLGHD